MNANLLAVRIDDGIAGARIAVARLADAARIDNIALGHRVILIRHLGELLSAGEDTRQSMVRAVVLNDAGQVRVARQTEERAADPHRIDRLGDVHQVLKSLRVPQGAVDEREWFFGGFQGPAAQFVQLRKTELIARPQQGGFGGLVEPIELQLPDTGRTMVAADDERAALLQAGQARRRIGAVADDAPQAQGPGAPAWPARPER